MNLAIFTDWGGGGGNPVQNSRFRGHPSSEVRSGFHGHASYLIASAARTLSSVVPDSKVSWFERSARVWLTFIISSSHALAASSKKETTP